MYRTKLSISLLALVSGCASNLPVPGMPMPLTSQLVLMAANNRVETNASAETNNAPILL